MGAAGGIRGPFLVHLAAVGAAAVVVGLLGVPRERVASGSDRAALRTAGFWLAAAGVLMVAVGYGALDGPPPLHFGELLSQAEIAMLYVGGAVAVSAVVDGRTPLRATLVITALILTAGISLAGIGESVPLWVVAIVLAAIGIGAGELGALGVLLETVGADRARPHSSERRVS